MSEIPEDIAEFAKSTVAKMEAEIEMFYPESSAEIIGHSILAERNRCISIAQSIEPHNEAEAHLIETIVRRMRGEV